MVRLLVTALLMATTLLTQPALAQDEPTAPGRMLLASDSRRSIVAIVAPDGSAVWERRIERLHDLHLLDNGNVLLQLNWTHIVEINPDNDEIVWQYTSQAVEGAPGIEVHAFQRLANGNTMIAESGNSRIIEVDAQGNIAKTVPLTVSAPSAHRDTRLVRVLDNGHYLVAHEGDGTCREYDAQGNVVWEYEVPLFNIAPVGGHTPVSHGNALYSAIRLDNGNTLIGTGNGHRVIEVTPEHEIVWMLTTDDLPGIELAWITTLQVLNNGNIVIGNCHAGPGNPQIIEVDRDKNVVWSFEDFNRFGNALTNSVIIEEPAQN